MTDTKLKMLSVDPGSVHVGVAIWKYSEHSGRWYCSQAQETTPERFADALKIWLDREQGRVAMESFRLQGDKAKQQTGSSFGEVELIGLARHECRWHGIDLELVTPLSRDGAYKRMRAVKWGFPKGVADHVWSAICVGAVATGWRAANHFEGDGMHTPQLNKIDS